MAYSFECISTHPDRRLNRKRFTTRCFSDNELCKFLDICENNGIPVSHVVAMGDNIYLVVYKWKQYVSVNDENI